MKNKNIVDEIIGWYGTVAIVLAYALVSNSLVSPTNYIYQLLNLTGAFGIIWISYKKKVYQSISLNIIWAIIAILAIMKLLI